MAYKLIIDSFLVVSIFHIIDRHMISLELLSMLFCFVWRTFLDQVVFFSSSSIRIHLLLHGIYKTRIHVCHHGLVFFKKVFSRVSILVSPGVY